MLKDLNELVRENVQETVVNNGAVPNEHNEAVIQAASGSIFDALKDQLASGDMGALTDLFKGGNAEGSAAANQASASFTDKLGGLGINSDTAKSLASSIIPGLISKFAQKTNDPNDSSFNLKDVLGSLSGGADGKLDMGDILGMFTGSRNQQPGQANTVPEQGGVLDQLKGIF